jgi:Fe-S cluster assembly protein SufD
MIQTPAKPASTPADAYWDKFEELNQQLAGREPAWLGSLRKAGLSRFAELGFPTLKDEDWRFTNVAPLAKLPFQPALSARPLSAVAEHVGAATFGAIGGTRLVFVDGHYSAELSMVPQAGSGIRIQSLAAVLEEEPNFLEKYLGRDVEGGPNTFLALNAAFFTDGALIYLPAAAALNGPVQLLHIATGAQGGASAHTRHVIIAERGAKLTVLENYLSAGSSMHVTNVATELVVGEGAVVEHCKFQEENLNAYHMATLHAHLGRNCNVIAHSFVTGARLSRNNIRAVLDGEGVECVLNGLYITRDDQLADHHMIVEHAKPHCNSHEYFNGILDGHSRGVFHGRILVRPNAQKTDAKQTNKNLLLSDDAGVNAKPQLEIYADDVKCTHGATIGQLNEESIFYLRARGIGQERARRMLIHAFASEIIDRIRHEPVREALDRLVWDRLEQNDQIAVTS